MMMLVAPTAARASAPSVFSDDHGICQRIKELEQISPDHRKRKTK